jgi:2-polyprenyl-3-methyl-5-hydroxy-6-metoxy-1,4-benzoquinol methylase
VREEDWARFWRGRLTPLPSCTRRPALSIRRDCSTGSSSVTGLQPGDWVLEVGAGPGKPTLPLARRGLRITALEPGPALAARARRDLAG